MLFRWITLAIVGFILYKLVSNELRKRKDQTDAAKPKAAPSSAHGAAMSKDPICGVYVEAASSVSVRDGDIVHHFCSYECRDAFLDRLKKGNSIQE